MIFSHSIHSSELYKRENRRYFNRKPAYMNQVNRFVHAFMSFPQCNKTLVESYCLSAVKKLIECYRPHCQLPLALDHIRLMQPET